MGSSVPKPSVMTKAAAAATSSAKTAMSAVFTFFERKKANFGSISYCARAYEEYIFYPWLIGEGVLIPLFEAYLKEKTA